MKIFLLFIILIILGGSVYQRFRKNISRYILKQEGDLEIFNYNVLSRLFVLYSFFTLLPILALILFTQANNLGLFANENQIILFVIANILFSLGIGTYQTSTIIERFIARPIRDHEKYISLRLAVKFFHGPVSHVLIYAGATYFLVSLCFYKEYNFENFVFWHGLLAFTSFTFGLVTGKLQRRNLCWFYQLPAFIVHLFLFLCLIAFDQIRLKNEFSVLTFAWVIGTIVYLIYKFGRAKFKNDPNFYSPKMWRV